VIPALVARWRAGYQVVYALRTRRAGETWFKRATATAFYRLIRGIASVDIPVDTGDFRLLDRRAADALRGLREQHRYVRGLAALIFLGIIGEYLGRIYDEVKGRPLYIVDESLGLEAAGGRPAGRRKVQAWAA
jgi:hypothetical protein